MANKAFTIIEILLIIAVILILATLSVLSLNDQKVKARDAKKINDIRQIQTALEFYNNFEEEYPQTDEYIILGSKNIKKLCSKREGVFVPLTQACNQDTSFMSNIPADQTGVGLFEYRGNINGYEIRFKTEKESSLGPAGIYYAHSSGIDNTPGIR